MECGLIPEKKHQKTSNRFFVRGVFGMYDKGGMGFGDSTSGPEVLRDL